MKRAVGWVALVAVATLGVTTLAAGPENGAEKPKGKSRAASTAAAAPRALPDGGVVGDAGADPLRGGGRPVRVHLLDGSTVSGTVRAEEAQALVIDCSLGLLSIPRARISTIAYDGAAELGSKHAPVQMLDDDVPPKKRTSTP